MNALSPSRRSFIGGAASIVALPAAAVSATAPGAAAAAPTALAAAIDAARQSESPELLKLGADLIVARQRFADAEVALAKAREDILKIAPPIPDGLPVPFGISIFGQLGWYCLPEPADILGNPIELPIFISPKGRKLPTRIPKAEHILKDLRGTYRLSHIPKWQKGEHRRLYDLAVAFEAAQDQAFEDSGLNAAEWEHYSAARALSEMCEAAAHAQATTVLGLLVKAQAIAACSVVPANLGGKSYAFYASGLLPAAVLNVLGGEA